VIFRIRVDRKFLDPGCRGSKFANYHLPPKKHVATGDVKTCGISSASGSSGSFLKRHAADGGLTNYHDPRNLWSAGAQQQLTTWNVLSDSTGATVQGSKRRNDHIPHSNFHRRGHIVSPPSGVSVYSRHLWGESPQRKLTIPPNGCQIVCNPYFKVRMNLIFFGQDSEL